MRAISKFKKTKQTSSSCSSCELNMKLADFKSYMYSFVVIAWQRNDPGGALWYFLGGYVLPGTPNWHPVLEKISPKIDTPF